MTSQELSGTTAPPCCTRGAGPAAALTGGFGWAFWACGVIGLAAVPVPFLLVRRNELAKAVASTTAKEPKPATVTAG
jgi:hypothetical protein